MWKIPFQFHEFDDVQAQKPESQKYIVRTWLAHVGAQRQVLGVYVGKFFDQS